MNSEPEFEIYDSCTADSLQKNDIVFHDGEYIVLTDVVDALDKIMLSGYAIRWDEAVDDFEFDPDDIIDLFRPVD